VNGVGHVVKLVLVRFDVFVLCYFLLVNSVYAVLLVSSGMEMRNHLLRLRAESRWRVLQSDLTPSISLLAPAHNEAATISESVQAMLGLYYPSLEVVVVDDGSTDATVAVLAERFELVAIEPAFAHWVDSAPVEALYRSRTHPNLVVVAKENGGKADALNAGLNVASGRLACAIDADTLIEADALLRMVRPFLDDNRVVAAGGTIRVVNASQTRGGRVVHVRAPRRALPGFQVVEYLRAFLFGRLGWNRLGGNLIISGAFGLFDRVAVLDAGGYARDTVGEDMDLVVRLRRRSYATGGPGRVAFIPDPVAWTEVPETFRGLGRQRDRWHRGLADVLRRNRGALFNPRYRAFGLVVYPYFLLVELLAPVVEALGVLGLCVGLAIGAVNWPFAALYFAVAYGYGVCLAALTLVLEELSFHRYEGLGDRAALMFWSLTENVGYRQLTVVWRLRGLIKFLEGRTDWGVMERKGFSQPEPPATDTPAEPSTGTSDRPLDEGRPTPA
jgi:cellulose synthase/poly-beta-1,6-N-acetylglucosamine synthase-like glycosyltransferase